MTVRELIDKLLGVPPDAEIFVEYDGGMEPLSAVRVIAGSVAVFHDGYGSDADDKDWTPEILSAKEYR